MCNLVNATSHTVRHDCAPEFNLRDMFEGCKGCTASFDGDLDCDVAMCRIILTVIIKMYLVSL